MSSGKGDKPAQILNIEPETELVFRGPFKDVVTTVLKLSNPSNEVVCFKVKTTAPKRYCVRPNCGLINPDESINIAVMLQPFDYKDSAENKRHKFLVQSVIPTTEIQPQDVEAFWKNTEGQQVMDSKLKCVFELPHDPANKESGELTNPLPSTTEKPTSQTFKDSLDSSPPTKQSVESTERPKSTATTDAKRSPILRQRQVNQPQKEPGSEVKNPTQTTRTTPTTPSQKTPMSAVKNPSTNIPPELRTIENNSLKMSFIIGIVMALILGIILGKFVL